ncbi:TPA: hypothetical protein PFE28_002834 [Kluyvera cryocrescens]|nr:hypothetical protein [Kluyvera cryocrescens]
MNDITALPPVTPEMLASLKLSASNLAEGEVMSFEPAVFRALIEALEAEQQKSAKQGRHACELFDEVKQLQEQLRTVELSNSVLESRTVTVKLPAEKFCPAEYAGSQLWSGTEVWNKAITACADALRAAGIQVIEGEGQ